MNKLSLVGGVLHYTPMIYPSQEVKSTTGAVYNKEGRFWVLPCSMANIEILIALHGKENIEFDTESEIIYISKYGFPLKLMGEVKQHIPSSILKSLKHYQLDSVQRMYSSPYKASLLSLSPGLGKSLTSIALAYAIQAKRVLVIAPLILLDNWKEEINKWSNGTIEVTIAHGEKPSDTGWTITNYNTIELSKKKKDSLLEYYKQPFDLVICDESILLKSRDIKRVAGIKEIRKYAKHIILLSGSPISRYYDDLYSQFNILFPKLFTSYWRFANNYVNIESTPWGNKISGSKQSIDIKKEFRDLMVVYSQEEVLPQLPQYIHQSYNFNMLPEQQRLYTQMFDEFLAQLDSEVELPANSKLAQLTRLQQIVSSPFNLGTQWPRISGKLDGLVELLELNEIPLPALIWSHWTGSNELIYETLKDKFPNLKIDHILGKTKTQDRIDILNNFKTGKLDIIVLSLETGKMGLNLPISKSVVYYDKSWNSDSYYQSLFRVRRIGLNHSPYHLTLKTPDSIDQLIEDNLANKMVSIAQVTNSDLSKLLKGIRHND